MRVNIRECLQLSEHTSGCTYIKKEPFDEKKELMKKNLVDCQEYRHSDWDLMFTSQRFRGPLHVIIKSLQKMKSLSEFCRQVFHVLCASWILNAVCWRNLRINLRSLSISRNINIRPIYRERLCMNLSREFSLFSDGIAININNLYITLRTTQFSDKDIPPKIKK